MLNRLITISIKVNIPFVPMRFARNDRGLKMKKRPPIKGFWSWLIGSGWGSGGSGG
jgi:hypothetical protein